MNKKLGLAIIVLLLDLSGFAQKKEPELPKIFTTAQYVCVETIYGPVDTTTNDPRVSPEDRKAVASVESAVRIWGRYELTMKRSDADVVFVVRTGRIAAAHGGVRVTRNPQKGTEAGPVAGGETGPLYDLLFVYPKSQDGSLGGPAWKRTLNHGLDMPDLPLFKKFKEEVEAASAKQTKRTP
jgi:hypothetical protein